MDNSHITEVRVTQNGKTRNYISKVSEAFSLPPATDDATARDVLVTLSATGRCINKLVTIVEVSKTLIPCELHQYTVLSTVERDDEEDSAGGGEGCSGASNLPMKSQLFITLSTHKLPDTAISTGNTGYQFHNPATAATTGTSSSSSSSDAGQGASLRSDSDKARDKASAAAAKSARRRRGGGKSKKKDIEDAKNVLY